MSGYTQSSGSIIDYVILRIFVLLTLSISWSWSLNRDECEAKRAFDSQSHQFDRGGIYYDLGDSRKLLLLLPFMETILVGRDIGHGNDNIIISCLSDNTGPSDIINTDDNHMGGIAWYYYYYYYLQDGEMEIDSHEVGHSATFTPGALDLCTPRLRMPSTSLHIGKYDAMAILSSGYLHTVTFSHSHSCHYFMCPILCAVHDCHRCHLTSNNGEWSARVSDTHEDNDHFYDYTDGYYAHSSAGVPEDGLAKISHQSPKRGDDLDARATASITGEMPEQFTNGWDFATSAPAPTDATLRLTEWIDVTTWTQCLITRSPISSALHTIHLTSANVVDPWGAIVGVMRSPTYTRLMTTYHTSTWVGYYSYSFAVTSFGPCVSTDTLPLHMHSCRCSNHDGGDFHFPWTVSSNLDGRNEQPKNYAEKTHTGCHCTSTNIQWSSYNSKSNRDVLQSDTIMDTYDKLVTTSCVPTWRDNSGSTVDSTAKKTKSTAFATLYDVSGIHMKAYGYGNVGMSYDSCQRLLYHVIGDLSVSLRCRLDILMRRPSINYKRFYLYKMKDGASHIRTIMSDVPDLQYAERDRLLSKKQDAVETTTLGTDSVICAASYELEIARGYCFDQSLNNGIGSPYKPSRDGKEYSDVISSGGHYWDASVLMIKSSSTYYADTQVSVCMLCIILIQCIL